MNNRKLNYVYYIANKLNIPVKTINNIHDRNKSIFLIESDENNYILKLCRNFSRKNIFNKKVNENYLNIEILVYEYLFKEKGKSFKVPRVVSWEKNKYILLEYIGFEKRSGNSYFDESALRAVKKSVPFPPLTGWVTSRSIEIGIRFHSSELR